MDHFYSQHHCCYFQHQQQQQQSSSSSSCGAMVSNNNVPMLCNISQPESLFQKDYQENVRIFQLLRNQIKQFKSSIPYLVTENSSFSNSLLQDCENLIGNFDVFAKKLLHFITLSQTITKKSIIYLSNTRNRTDCICGQYMKSITLECGHRICDNCFNNNHDLHICIICKKNYVTFIKECIE